MDNIDQSEGSSSIVMLVIEFINIGYINCSKLKDF